MLLQCFSSLQHCHLSCATLQFSCMSTPWYYGGVLIHLHTTYRYINIQVTMTTIVRIHYFIIWDLIYWGIKNLGGGEEVSLQFDPVYLIIIHHAEPNEQHLHLELVQCLCYLSEVLSNRTIKQNRAIHNQHRRHHNSSRLRYKSRNPEWKKDTKNSALNCQS